MTPTKRFSALRFSALLICSALGALALTALTPTAAWAQAKECNGFIDISYPNFPPPPLKVPPPKEFDVQIYLGTGTITGGAVNALVVDSFVVQLACWAGTSPPPTPAPLIPICEPDGPPNFPPQKIEFVGMVQDVCAGSTFTPSIGGVGNNVLTLTASSPIVIPANVPANPPGFCSVRFRLRALQGFSSDTITPFDIEETVNYKLALCDNGVLVSAGGQSASIPVMPTPGAPFISYETHSVAVNVNLPPTITIPLLGLSKNLPPAAILGLKRLQTPGAPASPQGPHMAGYRNFPLPGASGRKVMLSTNEFGQTVGKLGLPSFVLIDATKSLTGPLPPMPITQAFACYGFQTPLSGPIAWTDQFGPGKGSLKGTNRLCFPADLGGALGTQQPLLCARVENVTLGPNYPKNKPVWIGSAWGPSLPDTRDVELEGVDDFCAVVTQITVAP